MLCCFGEFQNYGFVSDFPKQSQNMDFLTSPNLDFQVPTFWMSRFQQQKMGMQMTSGVTSLSQHTFCRDTSSFMSRPNAIPVALIHCKESQRQAPAQARFLEIWGPGNPGIWTAANKRYKISKPKSALPKMCSVQGQNCWRWPRMGPGSFCSC